MADKEKEMIKSFYKSVNFPCIFEDIAKKKFERVVKKETRIVNSAYLNPVFTT